MQPCDITVIITNDTWAKDSAAFNDYYSYYRYYNYCGYYHYNERKVLGRPLERDQLMLGSG